MSPQATPVTQRPKTNHRPQPIQHKDKQYKHDQHRIEITPLSVGGTSAICRIKKHFESYKW